MEYIINNCKLSGKKLPKSLSKKLISAADFSFDLPLSNVSDLVIEATPLPISLDVQPC